MSEQQDLTAFVQNLLEQMQNKFQSMSDNIIHKIDEMGSRIDDLERSVNDLMDEAGLAARIGDLGSIEDEFLEECLQDRVQAAGSDVLGALVHLRRQLCDPLNSLVGEGELHAFGAEHGLVLPEQRVVWLDQDRPEVLDAEGGELHANRKAALGLRDEIGGRS